LLFSEIDLEPTLADSIQKMGYADTTPIQAEAIPLILNGKDIAGLAQTGTGKTAAFVIPMIDRILKGQKMAAARAISAEPTAESPGEASAITNRYFKDWKSNQFILILVPTRELAEQVQEQIHKLGHESGIKSFAIYGGTGYDRQKEALRSNLHFIVATPGRLIDLFKEHLIDMKQVRGIIFDEADRMFDMGFKDDMKFILQRIPRERQFLVFSATLNFEVLNTAYQFGADPVEINVSRDQSKAENVKDEIFHVGTHEKAQHLLSLMKFYKPKQAIIFTNFKNNVERIAQFLVSNDLPAMAISSLLTQAQRTKVIEQFKAENDMNILVATDVAARGLDIKGVDLVINFEMPNDSESYVHRIGRTGRAGAEGRAFSLVCDKDVDALTRLEDYLKYKVSVGFLEDKDLLKDFKPLPAERFGSYRNDSRSGGRDERRPRPPPRSGPRPQANSGPRPRHEDRPPRDGDRPRHEGDRPRRPSQQSNENKSARPDLRHKGPHPRHDGPRKGPTRHGDRPAQSRAQNGAARPRHEHSRRSSSSRPTPSVAKPKSIGQKVSSFFKKLLK
jgi:superfamily II DNA/RNA helicase